MDKDQLSAIIVDDEKEACDYLEELLKPYDHIKVVAKINEPDKAVKAIVNIKPDLVFLDIKMPGKNGFDVINEIKKYDVNFLVVFVTAFEEYAIQAIKYSAFDYLLKPVNQSELKETMNKLSEDRRNDFLDFRRNAEQLLENLEFYKKIKFNTRTGFILIYLSEIIYCKADRNYSFIYLINDKKEIVTCNLNHLEKLLPQTYFYRISRYNIINLKFLKIFERTKRKCILECNNNTYSFKIPYLGLKAFKKRINNFT